MAKQTNRNETESLLSRVSDEGTPVGDVLDKSSPEFPEGEEAVSWSPDPETPDDDAKTK